MSRLERLRMLRDALRMYKIVAIEHSTKFGEEHFETVKVNFRIAEILYLLDENEEAFTVVEDVYSKLKIISGPEDEDVLIARGYMANILRRTGKVALPIYQEIHEIVSRKWPLKKITLTTKINMALELSDEGKFSESLAIWDEIIQIYRQTNSVEDKIWSALGRKMCVLCKQGKYSEATSIARSLHDEKKAALGEDNPRTWSSLRDVAIVLTDQGECEQAEDILKVILNDDIKKKDEESICDSKFHLALVLKKQGKLDESLAFLKDLHINFKKVTLRLAFLNTMKLLANVLDLQGKYEEALHLYREILTFSTPGSPDMRITINNVFRTTAQLGKSEKTGSSPNELYKLESKKLLEHFEDMENYVENY